jgi:transcriptional regulator with XRE-family HTH domain
MEGTVGDRLRAAREEREFTQNAVANRTKMNDPEGKGISRTALIGYEQDVTNPGLREIKLLCTALTVSPNWLIYGSDSAPTVSLPSSELLRLGDKHAIDSIIRTAAVLLALKGHERDAIQTLALSLAGRQLGDARLSGLVFCVSFLRDAFLKTLQEYSDEISDATKIEELAEILSTGAATNHGNRLRFNDQGDILNPEQAVYPDPKITKIENSTKKRLDS